MWWLTPKHCPFLLSADPRVIKSTVARGAGGKKPVVYCTAR